MRARWPAVVPPLIGVMVTVTGCFGTPKRTITGAQAIKRLDSYLTTAIAAAPGGLAMSREKAEATNTSGCMKGLSDAEETGQVEAEVIYTAEPVAPDIAAQYLDTLATLWKHKWGDVTRQQDHVGIQISNGKFRLFALYWSGQRASRRLEVGGTSECIWVNGTPGPDDNP